jgi:hypothetical protein
LLGGGGGEKYFHRGPNPLSAAVLLVKVRKRRGRALGSKEGSVLVCGLLVVCSRRKELTVWSEFVYVGQHCDGTVIALGD